MPSLSRRNLLKAFFAAAALGMSSLAMASARKSAPAASRWVRSGIDTDALRWGFRRGIQIAAWPDGIEGSMPRGLFQIGYPILENGARMGLVNVMAVEPIVKGSRGFSEMETSQSDGLPGKRIDVMDQEKAVEKPSPGALTRQGRVETLTVRFQVERFENGAQVQVEALFRSDRPDEVCWRVSHTPGSAPIEQCILTATMGNYARLRQLWLRDEVVTSTKLFADYRDIYFAPNTYFPLDRLPRNRQGDIVVCMTTDEAHPEREPPDPNAPGWQYRGSFPVTQYWRKPKGTWQPDLTARVNGRRVYWAGQIPIPRGIAYENFDLVERYAPGAIYCFGVTRRRPRDLVKVAPISDASR